MVTFPDPRRGHPFHMHDMIHAQHLFISETLQRLERVDLSLFKGNPSRLYMTGCGTSFHAATYGARMLREALPSSTSVEATHAYDLAYGSTAVPMGATVLGLSHSGTTPTTNRALVRARKAGSRTLAFCGRPNTPMDEVSDETLVIGTSADRSWANTMSYTSQLAALASIAARRMQDSQKLVENIHSIPGAVRKALACEASIRSLAKRIARASHVTYLGSGWDDITALEGALKIRETCSLSASGYHIEQFLHGPFLSIAPREPIVLLRSRDDGDRAEDIRNALSKGGATVTTIGEHPRASIRLPRTHPYLRPIVSVVPLQLLAYYVALARHTNPDIMRTDVPRYRRALATLSR